ncbi:TetR/AcrR family transcriptional regulator [Leptospira limi]|uniref:TetR/AcrR family transcriptional regulator n=1 Tax=Leptospira limi TaxID=2950023 RepID=A0ABT3LUP4_9LEPT|nr:TetR/AcrR family transcriptional regulator [Leptospira limi]MCW7461437.1 TetR/AcrR family transcriptional regulator [Leptospira limi]
MTKENKKAKKTISKPFMGKRNLEITRRKILLIAFETFFKQGFQGTSMDDLVKKTTLSKGAFYHQFSTKLELGYAVVEEVISPLILDRWIVPLDAYEDPIAGILFLMQQNIGNTPPALLRYGCPLNNLIQEMSPVDNGFKRRLTGALNLWIRGLENHLLRAKMSGLIQPHVDVTEAAHFIVMAHEGFYGIIKGLAKPKIFPILMASMQNYFDHIRKW